MSAPWRHPIPLALRRPVRSVGWLARRGRQSVLQPGKARIGSDRPAPPAGVDEEDFPEAEGPFVMGVNTPLFFTDTKYGRLTDIVNDMDRLGAGLLRHPGRLQIFIDHLLYEWTPGAEVPDAPLRRNMLATPIDKALVEAGDAELDLRVGNSFPMHYLDALCRLLRRTGRRGPPFLVLTFLDLGQGAPTEWDELVGLEGGPSREPTKPGFTNPIFLPWAADTIGHEVEQIVTGELVSLDTDDNWNRFTLDPRSAYKRSFYARLAGAIGRWLAARWGLLRDYVAGVEIGNELETFHAVRTGSDSVEPDGTAWGDLYYDCSHELRRACADVPLLLPALASYAGEMDPTADDPRAWGGKKVYLEAMLDQIQTRAAGSGLFRLHELVDGLDLHYYHMGQQTDGSDRPAALAHLAVALRECRSVLDEFDWSTAYWWTSDPPWLTCIETSTNVMALEDPGTMTSTPADAYPLRVEPEAIYADYASSELRLRASERPPVYERLPTVDVRFSRIAESAGTLDFQGQSVWQRLAVAVLGGARVVGWHSPIGIRRDSFEGVGLRYDHHDNEDPASQSSKRPSWWAFREFGRTLAPARMVRLNLPERLTSRTALGDIPSFTAEDMLWVIEFEQAAVLPGGARGYAYLAFIDPYWPIDSADPRPVGAELNFSADRSRSLFVLSRPTWPAGEPTLIATPSEGYPLEVWPRTTASTPIGVTASGSRHIVAPVSVALGRYPLLLASPRQLQLDSLTLVTE